MMIGIDGSNLRDGGGVTHLVEVLRAADPAVDAFGEIVVWGGADTLDRLESRPWLRKVQPAELAGSARARLTWQQRGLPVALHAAGADVLFAPGGLHSGRFHPVVTMCRNMLPFTAEERARYGWSWMRLRLTLLQYAQARSFRRADGVIFLTAWAKQRVELTHRVRLRRTRIIPHGTSERFRQPPRPALPSSAYSAAKPFRLLYVSIVSPYKHQWNVARAVGLLRQQGLPIVLDLVGPCEPCCRAQLDAALRHADPTGEYIRYHGPVSYDALHEHYHRADAFVFASTCENLPNILIEAMSASLPIASSRFGPMPEILGDAGLYFDPLSSENTAEVLQRLFRDHHFRRESAERAVGRAARFSWTQCARHTFRFLRESSPNRKR